MTTKGSVTPTPVKVEVTLRGHVPARMKGYAVEKIGHVAAYTRLPVRTVHVVLDLVADPARERPALAEAVLDVDGTPVRAQVAASQPGEAIDLLADRLRGRLEELGDRLRTRRRRWIGEPSGHQWRHGDLPAVRAEYFPRPVEEREVLRRTTFVADPMSLEEAALDMDLLGHDFYLFTEIGTGRHALIHRLTDGKYALRGGPADALPVDTDVPVLLEGLAESLSQEQAVEHLDAIGEPFVFYIDRTNGRGCVLYRRHDGHYGLITTG
jgi:ribosome-associated translation inhibitor RaiA